MNRNHSQRDRHTSPRGMILVLVLVVVTLLSFAVYSFSSLMLTEYEAATAGLTHLQRRELANSGIELAALRIRQDGRTGTGARTTVSLCAPTEISLPNNRQGWISLLRELPETGQSPIFGLKDESAKLNINTLPLELSKRREARWRLMQIPGLTIQMADAILDWMDPDDEVSEFGAETSYYTSQTPPRRPAQCRFTDLLELLQVRGMTTDLLYGSDLGRSEAFNSDTKTANRFRRKDDGSQSLKRGWSDFITVQSGESTRMSGGQRKINLNQPNLAMLYDQLEPVLGTEAATWVVAWRMRGAHYPDEIKTESADDAEQQRLERLESVQRRLAVQLGDAEKRETGLTAEQTSRGGLALSEGAMKFQSLIELFGGQVRIAVDGTDTLLQSPWAADPATLRRMLPVLESMLTYTDAEFLPGRININVAPVIVLRTIPGMSESLAGAVARTQSEIRQSLSNDEFASVAWLASRGLVSVAQLRSMGPYITTHGDIRSGIAVGQTDTHRSVAMVEFMIRVSGPDTHILSFQDIPAASHKAVGLPWPPRAK